MGIDVPVYRPDPGPRKYELAMLKSEEYTLLDGNIVPGKSFDVSVDNKTFRFVIPDKYGIEECDDEEIKSLFLGTKKFPVPSKERFLRVMICILNTIDLNISNRRQDATVLSLEELVWAFRRVSKDEKLPVRNKDMLRYMYEVTSCVMNTNLRVISNHLASDGKNNWVEDKLIDFAKDSVIVGGARTIRFIYKARHIGLDDRNFYKLWRTANDKEYRTGVGLDGSTESQLESGDWQHEVRKHIVWHLDHGAADQNGKIQFYLNLSPLYRLAGIDLSGDSRKQMERLRKDLEKYLNNERVYDVDGFEPIKTGNKFIAYKVYLKRK